ncbi:MAG: carbohydrate ABC transporter permease, partial [Phycisphaerae bacterium]|nr:carbohydrate ABC transporter permease [Phycisphaerae bacterium]MDW8262501.1 carbohydrate ABC transporter permease [Phycisphaerales bacterium]
VTWQKPGPDDRSTKLRMWIVLEPTEAGPQFDPGPQHIRVFLEVRRLTALQAGFAKLRHNYIRVLEQIPFWRYVRVSILLVILNILLTLLSSSLVAYAFARLQWPGRDLAFLVMLGTLMIPGQVTMIPHFLIWSGLGAYNTLTPLYLGAAFGNAFYIFLMRQFLKGVPTDLEDAARIDGCGFLRIYWHVMLPLVKPSLAAIAIFTFMGTWNDFLGPLLYIADQRLYPLAFGLYAFSVQVSNNPVLTMAASLLMTLPVIVLFFLAQRYFVQGITLTGMKG